MALTLESHLDQLRGEIEDGKLAAVTGQSGNAARKRLSDLEDTCYICRRTQYHFDHILDTVVLLWDTDDGFRKKFNAQPYFCLPHYNTLLEYAKKGGNLVLIGKNTCTLFAKNGAPFEARPWAEFKDTASQNTQNGHDESITQEYKPYFFTMDKLSYGTLFSPCEIIATDGESKAEFMENERCDGASLSVSMKYGKGSISALGFDIGSQYLFGTQYMHRAIMKKVTDGAYEPLVKIENAIGRLEIVPLSKDGRLMIQLINAGGTHANSSCATDDYIPPVLDIELSIAFEKEPKALILQPEGIKLDFKYENGKANVKIPRIDIHNIIEACK
jgi:hypothetical protein